jgi:hypothetical protein
MLTNADECLRMQARVDLRVDASAEADPAVLAQAKEVCVLCYTAAVFFPFFLSDFSGFPN